MNAPMDILRDGNQFIANLRHRRRAHVFILSGPSGVGKDAIIERLRESEVDTHFAITATTRPPRDNEIEGRHYYFWSETDFHQRIAAGLMLEHATVYQHHYGVPRDPVEAALNRGQDVVIKIDVQGAAAVRKVVPGAVSIFLAPESMESLYSRLSARKSDDPVRIQQRFAEAAVELRRANEFDYVVFNETNGILRALDDVRAIFTSVRSATMQPEIRI